MVRCMHACPIGYHLFKLVNNKKNQDAPKTLLHLWLTGSMGGKSCDMMRCFSSLDTGGMLVMHLLKQQFPCELKL